MTTECTCWRKHSVSFAKGKSCPRDIETLQAAWDRDQELIEEQRQELARRMEKINQLRQEIESLKAGNKGAMTPFRFHLAPEQGNG